MSFKIQLVRKQAVIFFPDGGQLGGNFFVSPTTPNHGGSGYIIELLRDNRNFIPFETDSGYLALVRKKNMVMVQLGHEDSDRNIPVLKQMAVNVILVTGENIMGMVHFTLPENHSRLSDFLNTNEDFFYLNADKRLILVQTRFVKLVTPAITE